MDINTIVLIVILAVIVYAIVSHNQEKSSVAEQSRQEIMAEKEDNQIKITIFGQEYSVKAPADPTYIKKIAEYVDTKMREVQSGFSSTQSSNRIAILSAMNITDELFNAKKRGDSNNNEIEEKITSLIELIDESV